MQKNETRAPTYTIHKNKLKMDENLNISHDTIKVLEENIGRKISDSPCSNIFTVLSAFNALAHLKLRTALL